MTVLHVCDYSAPYKGNFIPSLEALNECRDIHNVYLFPSRASRTGALSWIDELNKNGIAAYVQKKNIFANLFLLYRILRRHKVNAVCKHFYDIKIDALLKLLFDSKKVLRFMHCMYDKNAASGLKHKLRRFLWSRNTLIGVSEVVSECLAKPFSGFKIVTLENGIFFSRLDGEKTFNFGDEITIACMGYNVYVKGVDLALKAIKKVRENRDVKLNIIAASHKNELISFIEHMFGSFPNWIKILPPTSNIGEYFRGIDVFLAPSRTEACPYAVIEAAYCKCAIVASRVGGQAKLDIDGIYWFNKEDVDDLSAQIEKAISEVKSQDRVAKAKQVSRDIQSRYSLTKWRDEVVDMLSSIV